jgi:N-methylhydantoinase A
MTVPGNGAWRIGIDIGGTFTDGVLWNTTTGMRFSAKVLSTPEDLSQGFMNAVNQLFRKSGGTPTVEYVAHGTTAATNAVLEGQLAPVALVTTKGFRDVLEIARQVRPDPYDVFAQKPKPLVPRNHCFEVDERMSAEGTVLQPLARASLPELATALHDANVEAVAICLLHSYANPDHEIEVAAALERLLPGVPVTLSSVLAPEFREYPRACTTVINAGLLRRIDEYLMQVEARLEAIGVQGKRRVMQSNGGLLSFAQARRDPVKILESGPAAGLIGATKLSSVLDRPMLISFDMGGTTAKLGLIRNGEAEMVPELEVGMEHRSRSWFTGASGYPILTPALDLVEIGAGGGSIAWVDRGGKLRVGPVSAGATPGPACYGLGGNEATVTDANVVLGRMSPTGLLGGDLEMDFGAAWGAVDKIAKEIDCEATEAALGILEIASAAMARATRTISVERGYDPRLFSLVAFGGAGPLHAAKLADDLGITEIIVQREPGIASAIGLLVTDLRCEFSKTWLRPCSTKYVEELRNIVATLETTVRATFEGETDNITELRLQRMLDMRYVGQSYQLSVPLAAGPVTGELIDSMADDFHRMHNVRYGHSEATEPVEIVNVRLSGIGVLRNPPMPAEEPPTRGLQEGDPVSKRTVTFANGLALETPVYNRSSLPIGWEMDGPAVIEEHDSTTLVPDHWSVKVATGANLLLARD